MITFIFVLCWLNYFADSRSLLRSAPQMCPIDEENLIEVKSDELSLIYQQSGTTNPALQHHFSGKF